MRTVCLFSWSSARRHIDETDKGGTSFHVFLQAGHHLFWCATDECLLHHRPRRRLYDSIGLLSGHLHRQQLEGIVPVFWKHRLESFSEPIRLLKSAEDGSNEAE